MITGTVWFQALMIGRHTQRHRVLDLGFILRGRWDNESVTPVGHYSVGVSLRFQVQ